MAEDVSVGNELTDSPYAAFNLMAYTTYGDLVGGNDIDDLLSLNIEVLTASLTRSVCNKVCQF